MKTYMNPMLQVISINKKDIIATSGEPEFSSNAYTGGDPILSAGRRFDIWYEGEGY